MARVTKDFSQNMVNQFIGYIKSPNKGEARWRLCLLLGKVEMQDTYALTDGVQVVLSTRVRRTDQDWFKCLPIYKSFNASESGNTRQALEAESLPQREEQTFLEGV